MILLFPQVRAIISHMPQGNASGLEWVQLRHSLLNPESGFAFSIIVIQTSDNNVNSCALQER